MRLEGVGGSSAATIPSSNVASQPMPGERRVKETGGNDRDQLQKPDHTRYVEEKRYSEEDVIQIIEQANHDFVAYDRKFEFSIHEKTKQIMIKILDSTTGEVIKELPSEKVLDMVAGLWEVAGIIVDRKI